MFARLYPDQGIQILDQCRWVNQSGISCNLVLAHSHLIWHVFGTIWHESGTTEGVPALSEKRTFGSIRKLPSGRYQARYTAPTGAYIVAPKTFAAKIHAETWLGDRKREIDANLWDPAAAQRRPRVIFENYATDWLATRQVAGRPIKARTRKHYEGVLKRELVPAFGARPLTAITPADVRGWHARTLVDKPTMRAHTYDLLKTILATAITDELIDANPCRIRGAGSSKRAVHKVTPASVIEIETITAKMPDRLQLAVTCASWLAMRLGEILELRRGDVDPDAGVVRIRRAVVRVGGQLQLDTPKTDAGVRDVAIPPHLIERFRDHLMQYTSAPANALLFPSNADPARWLQSKALYKDFRKARAAAARTDLRWHDLRHSGAVLAAGAGASLAELMARLGHSTPAAAMRYQHAAEGRDHAVAEAMSKLLETGGT
jgi:integrase